MKKVILFLMFALLSTAGLCDEVSPVDLPKIEVERKIEAFRITQNWNAYEKTNSIMVQVFLRQGDNRSDYVFTLEGDEYDLFYSKWTSCDDVFNLIYEKLGINSKVKVNSGENLCYNHIQGNLNDPQ